MREEIIFAFSVKLCANSCAGVSAVTVLLLLQKVSRVQAGESVLRRFTASWAAESVTCRGRSVACECFRLLSGRSFGEFFEFGVFLHCFDAEQAVLLRFRFFGESRRKLFFSLLGSLLWF